VNYDGSPFELDRELTRAHEAWRAWRRRLELNPQLEDTPLERFRPHTSRRTFMNLGRLPEDDPLRDPLRRWVYRLGEERVNQAALTEVARSRYAEQHPLSGPKAGDFSLSELLERALTERGKRAPWLAAFTQHATPTSNRMVTLWQRRGEFARRLGFESPLAMESSVDDAAGLAQGLATRLRERVAEAELGSPQGWLDAALGEDVRATWPARLNGQRLLDFFRDGSLFRGLELGPRRLPSAVGAASFMLGFGRLGGAWFDAQTPTDQPFCIARDPYRLDEHVASYLFALLPLNPSFLARKLDVGKDALGDIRRRLAQIWALELSAAALRVRLRAAAFDSESRLRETYEELAELDLGLRLPRSLAGVFFRLRSEDEQRFLGLLLAAERAAQLTEAHDEDWFRNPRAIEQLRAEAKLPPRKRIAREVVESAAALTMRGIEAAWK
jgi:hypothetical protein